MELPHSSWYQAVLLGPAAPETNLSSGPANRPGVRSSQAIWLGCSRAIRNIEQYLIFPIFKCGSFLPNTDTLGGGNKSLCRDDVPAAGSTVIMALPACLVRRRQGPRRQGIMVMASLLNIGWPNYALGTNETN